MCAHHTVPPQLIMFCGHKNSNVIGKKLVARVHVPALTHIRTIQLANAWTRNSFVWMCIIVALYALLTLTLSQPNRNERHNFFTARMLIILCIFCWDELIVVFTSAARFHLLVSEPPNIFSAMHTPVSLVQFIDGRNKKIKPHNRLKYKFIFVWYSLEHRSHIDENNQNRCSVQCCWTAEFCEP